MTVNPFVFIVLTSIIATTLMTSFSEALTRLRNYEFNEAELLNQYVFGNNGNFKGIESFWGWLVHYLMGIVVTTWMYVIYAHCNFPPNIDLGLLLGFLVWIVGAISWTGLFYYHSYAPHTGVTVFLLQLLVAHLIFGSTVAILFQFVF